LIGSRWVGGLATLFSPTFGVGNLIATGDLFSNNSCIIVVFCFLAS
jgi:hypothetical protein